MRARQKSKVVPAEPPVPVEVIPEGRQEKIHYFLQKVEDHVAGLIDTDSVKIPKQQIPFADPKKDDAETLASRLRKMQASREAMQSKLQSIAEEEQDLKFKHRQLEKLEGKGTARQGTGKEGGRDFGIRPRSELSADDISLLRRLKKEHRQFERSLDEKTQAHLQAMDSIRKEEAELQQRKKRQEGEVKRKEIGKRLQALNKQRSERQQQFQEQKRRLVELKAKKKLFEEAERAQREKEKDELEKKVALMESRLKEKELDLQSIRSHEEKYREIREQQRAERQRKKEQFQEAAKHRREDTSFQKSKYYTIAHQETKRRKQEELEKQREKQDLIEAAKAYAEEVRRERSPRANTKSSSEPEQEKAEGLTFQEVKSLGNNYMQQMRKVLKKRKPNNNNSQLSKDDKSKDLSSRDTTLPLKLDHPSSTNTSKYRDYLSERRMLKPKEEMSQTEDRIRDRLIRRDLADVYRIMNSKDERGDKLDRVKTIAQKLDVREKGDDHHMIDKISAKLKILETLTDSR